MKGHRYRIFDALGAWMLEALPGLFIRGLIALIILVIGIQIGIYKGRWLEREAIKKETAELNAALVSLEMEVERLRVERQALGLLNESQGLSLNVEGPWTSARH